MEEKWGWKTDLVVDNEPLIDTAEGNRETDSTRGHNRTQGDDLMQPTIENKNYQLTDGRDARNTNLANKGSSTYNMDRGMEGLGAQCMLKTNRTKHKNHTVLPEDTLGQRMEKLTRGIQLAKNEFGHFGECHVGHNQETI